MLATRADALKTGELADERAHERFPQPTVAVRVIALAT